MKTSKKTQKTVDEELKSRFSAVFKASGMGQVEFGKLVGQTQTGISQVVAGPREPSKAMLQAVITKLDISPEWLYSGTGSMKREPAKAGVTREDLETLRADLEDACEVIRFLLTQLPEGSRPGVLPKRFR